MGFNVRFRGFDRKQVGEYVAIQARRLEQLEREKADSQAEAIGWQRELKILRERIVQLEARENAVGMAMIQAQQDAARRVAAAGTEAREILDRSNAEAARARDEAALLQGQLITMRREAIQFLRQLLADLGDEPAENKPSVSRNSPELRQSNRA